MAIFYSIFQFQLLFIHDRAALQSVLGGGISIYSPMSDTFKDDTMQSRMGRTTAGESVRPMTATFGAGFQSNCKISYDCQLIHILCSSTIYSLTYYMTTKANRRPSALMNRNREEKSLGKTEINPQETARKLESEIHQMIEDSSMLLVDGQSFNALQISEAATKKEKKLAKHRKSHSLSTQQGQRLTFAVWFHLAKIYEENKRYDKATETYESLIKQKRFKEYTSQLRINIGNLLCLKESYPHAIRMYQMALDHTKHEEKELKSKILRNIGNAFLKYGNLRNALLYYEDSIEANYDTKSSLNLLTCYVELGDEDKCRQTLFNMMNQVHRAIHASEREEESKDLEVDVKLHDKRPRKNHRSIETVLHIACRLVAAVTNTGNWVDSFLWVIEQLRQKFPHLSFQLEIERAFVHLQKGEFTTAIKVLKSYENNDIAFKAMVSTNLSFLYFLEGNYSLSEQYADIAITSNKYNPNALVNKGNCLFILGNYVKAREYYLEAIAIESSCFEAIYNLALTNIRLGQTSEAMQSFVKLHTVTSNDPRVIYQVANLYEEMEDKTEAIKWFNVLCATLPTAPGVMSRLGQLFLLTENESQSYHYHLESYRCLPSDIDVIGWIAIWFVKHDIFEKSIHFFLRASQIQPQEVKWKIMICSCYRKMGKEKEAYRFCKKALKENPHNIECEYFNLKTRNNLLLGNFIFLIIPLYLIGCKV